MHFQIMIGTGSYTTSTTNMYNKTARTKDAATDWCRATRIQTSVGQATVCSRNICFQKNESFVFKKINHLFQTKKRNHCFQKNESFVSNKKINSRIHCFQKNSSLCQTNSCENKPPVRKSHKYGIIRALMPTQQ